MPRHHPAQQQLPKLHIRSPGSLAGHPQLKHAPLHSLQQIHDPQSHDGKSENASSQMYPASLSPRNSALSQQQQNFGLLSSQFSLPSSTTTSMLLQQIQPVFATQNLGSQASLPSIMVPVRIQTHVPSFGSVMYTSVSQLVASSPGCADISSMSPPVGAASTGKPTRRELEEVSTCHTSWGRPKAQRCSTLPGRFQILYRSNG